MTQPRMPETAPPLSRRVETAFARLDPATPVPPRPRSVRIGVDYSLRVSGMDPQTDAEADSLAYACFVLGNLAKRDPPGDPAGDGARRKNMPGGPERIAPEPSTCLPRSATVRPDGPAGVGPCRHAQNRTDADPAAGRPR